jgi:hypothetical protein
VIISGFYRVVNKIFVLLGRYAAYIGSYSPAFRDSLSVPSPTVRHSNNNAESQASQDKVLTGGGDLLEAQVDVPFSVSHSRI